MATRQSAGKASPRSKAKSSVNKAPQRSRGKSKGSAAAKSATRGAGSVKPLPGGNPQIAKAERDAPVQVYTAAMPASKSAVGERLDALTTRVVPEVKKEVKKAVKWNSPFHGLEGRGWFVSFHIFARHVKVTFFKGTSLDPVPPRGTSQEGRWIDVREDDLDEAQIRKWVKQAAALRWTPRWPLRTLIKSPRRLPSQPTIRRARLQQPPASARACCAARTGGGQSPQQCII